MAAFTESVVEEAALAWLKALGYSVLHGPDIAPGEIAAERTDYGQVVLEDRLRQALARLLAMLMGLQSMSRPLPWKRVQ